METIKTDIFEQAENKHGKVWKIDFKDWEMPQEELEVNPEYKHFIKVCDELGLIL